MSLSTTKPDRQQQPWLALYERLAALSATLDPQRVLETALQGSSVVIASLGGQPEQLASAALLFPDDETQPHLLRIAAMRGFSPEECGIELPGMYGLIGQVIQHLEPQLTNQIETDPELSKLASLLACKEAFCIPLGKSPLQGVILYGHPELGYFSEERCLFLELLAGQTWLALSSARRFRESQLKIEQLLDLQEQNREEMARELHDGPIQSVAAMAMRVNIARRLAAREAPGIVDELAKIEAVARQATGELRQLLFRLHPQLLESQGLAAALQELGEKTGKVHGRRVQIQVEPDAQGRLDMNKQMAVFDLIDRALREISKKEELENIWVRLENGSQGQVELEIEDDGLVVPASGWNPAGTSRAGKAAVQNQVATLGGSLETVTKGNHGSYLKISFSPEGQPAGSLPGSA